jgi:hypothetical protein
MRSKKILGIPIIVKLTKKGAVSSIFAIPYRHIATHLSNVRGAFRGPGYSSKGVGMERLISERDDCGIDDWYCVRAVEAFFNIEMEDDIDKNIVAWYNPYMKKITGITDAYKNPVEKSPTLIQEILDKYSAKQKEADTDKYFINISSDKYANISAKSCWQYFKSPQRTLQNISRLKGYLDEDSSEISTHILRVINDIPLCRFMEASVFATMKKTLAIAYMLSDNISAYAYRNEHVSKENLRMYAVNRGRYLTAYNLFCQNSILAFQALLDMYGCGTNDNIGEVVLNKHFSNIPKGKDSLIYTDSLYRILGLCIGFKSVGPDLLQRVKNARLEGLNVYHSVGQYSIFDDYIGLDAAVFADFYSRCFCSNASPSNNINSLDCDVHGVYNLSRELALLFRMSKYIASSGDMMACYDNNGKEYYRYAKQ